VIRPQTIHYICLAVLVSIMFSTPAPGSGAGPGAALPIREAGSSGDQSGFEPGSWDGPGVPFFLPYQQAWINDNATVAMAEKSRRIGFTFAEAYRSVERRIRLGTDHYFASRDFESAKLFIEDCGKFARMFGVVAEDMGEQVIDRDKDIKAHVIRFANGAKIMALTSNPDVFRGKGGDITLDEFAFHKDQKGVLKAAMASAKIWGHQVRIISTHNGEGALYNKLIVEVVAGKRRWSLHSVTLESAVDQGLYEVIRSLAAKTAQERERIIREPDLLARKEFIDSIREDCIDSSEWDEEYCCRPNSDQSSYLNYDLIDQCATLLATELFLTPADLPTGKGIQYFAGYDVGRRHDLSVLWVVRKVGDVYTTVILVKLSKARYRVQEGLLRELLKRPDLVRLCIDETGIGNMLAERLKEDFGHKVEPVTFTNDWKNTAAPYFRRWFEDRLIRIPGDDALREDLHKTRKVVTDAGNVRLLASSDDAGHADQFWAGVLMCEAARDQGAKPRLSFL
jgi:phage FluMu gp28-like protein